MKFVANLLVAVHNVAAAEAVSLGLRCVSTPRRYARSCQLEEPSLGCWRFSAR